MAETRDKIIRAAMKVFARHGLFRAPISLIAREAGVSKALIFWYFRSKDELIQEVVKQALPLDIVKKCLDKKLEGRRLLECIARNYFSKYSNPETRMLLLHIVSARGIIDYVDEAFEELCTHHLDRVAELAWGKRGKEAKIRARMLFGSLLCYALNPPQGITPEEYISQIVDVLAQPKEKAEDRKQKEE